MKNKEINENQELKDLNNEFKTYVLYKILNYCTDNEISLQKYQIKYLGVKGSSYDHLIQKDSGFKLTQLTAMKLLKPIMSEIDLISVLTEFNRKYLILQYKYNK